MHKNMQSEIQVKATRRKLLFFEIFLSQAVRCLLSVTVRFPYNPIHLL